MNKLATNIAAQKKRVADYENAIEQLKSFRSLRNSWRKLLKRGRLQPVSFYRSLSFMMPQDHPVDMSEVWNWMVKYDRAEAKAYHVGVAKMLDDAISHWTKQLKTFAK